MNVEGGNKAINNLHGKAISKNGKPLVVELSREVRLVHTKLSFISKYHFFPYAA